MCYSAAFGHRARSRRGGAHRYGRRPTHERDEVKLAKRLPEIYLIGETSARQKRMLANKDIRQQNYWRSAKCSLTTEKEGLMEMFLMENKWNFRKINKAMNKIINLKTILKRILTK